jgi:antitoxin FitA
MRQPLCRSTLGGSPGPTTSFITPLVCAPSATQTQISCVRCVTSLFITPETPTAPSSRASAAQMTSSCRLKRLVETLVRDSLKTPRDPTRVKRLDMSVACEYVVHMSKMIQLRHVPDELHRKLKARAALEGLSLSDYLLQEVRRMAERPTTADLRARLARRAPAALDGSPSRAIRQERDRR